MKPLPQRIRPGILLTTVVTVAILLTACSSAGSESRPSTPPVTSPAPSAASPQQTPAETTAALAALEKKYSADLGVSALDTRTGRTVEYDADERFAFASTYKALAAGVLFDRASDAELAATIHYTAADLVDYSPITSKHVDDGMSLRDVIAAALQYSDNTAANLLLNQLGGPAALEAALRSLGDTTTNVDRTEPGVNTATPGDLRDTTTPKAIGRDLRTFVLGDVLTPARRATMKHLMLGNTTGGPWTRAGVPAGWSVADKTGNAGYGTRNDVAIAYRPGGAPVVISILSDRNIAGAASDDGLLAEATREVVRALG